MDFFALEGLLFGCSFHIETYKSISGSRSLRVSQDVHDLDDGEAAVKSFRHHHGRHNQRTDRVVNVVALIVKHAAAFPDDVLQLLLYHFLLGVTL